MDIDFQGRSYDEIAQYIRDAHQQAQNSYEAQNVNIDDSANLQYAKLSNQANATGMLNSGFLKYQQDEYNNKRSQQWLQNYQKYVNDIDRINAQAMQVANLINSKENTKGFSANANKILGATRNWSFDEHNGSIRQKLNGQGGVGYMLDQGKSNLLNNYNTWANSVNGANKIGWQGGVMNDTKPKLTPQSVKVLALSLAKAGAEQRLKASMPSVRQKPRHGYGGGHGYGGRNGYGGGKFGASGGLAVNTGNERLDGDAKNVAEIYKGKNAYFQYLKGKGVKSGEYVKAYGNGWKDFINSDEYRNMTPKEKNEAAMRQSELDNEWYRKQQSGNNNPFAAIGKSISDFFTINKPF